MNRVFFNRVETHLNPERLDAYRQDGVDEVTRNFFVVMQNKLIERVGELD